jgi:hypothetical protein
MKSTSKGARADAEPNENPEGTMTNRSRTSQTATVTYVGEMAKELARMAGEIQCPKLAYLLEVAALEARTVAQPHIEVRGEASGLH